MCRDSAVFSLKVILAPRDHVSVTDQNGHQRKPAGTKKDSKRTQIASSSGRWFRETGAWCRTCVAWERKYHFRLSFEILGPPGHPSRSPMVSPPVACKEDDNEAGECKKVTQQQSGLLQSHLVNWAGQLGLLWLGQTTEIVDERFYRFLYHLIIMIIVVDSIS